MGRISEQDYDGLVGQAKDFLAGKSGQVQADLQMQMAKAAEALDFETAAILRDRLRAATFIQGSQAINASGVGDADIFALAHKGGHMGVQAFFVRGGQNWGHRAFFPSHTKDIEESQVLADVILQFYEEVPPPPMVLVDRELPETELIEAALSELAQRKVQFSVPQRGDRRKLMAQASRNAIEALERRLAETGTRARVNRELAEFLELDAPPQRIEVYDNSHIQGAKAVGAMIVAGPEGFEKSQYRKFNIRSAQTNDDFGMMREVMERRFTRAMKDDPDRTRDRAGSAGRTRDRRWACDRHCQGAASRARGARGVSFPRWPGKDASDQLAAAVPSSEPARRGPPLCHRRAPGKTVKGDHCLAAR